MECAKSNCSTWIHWSYLERWRKKRSTYDTEVKSLAKYILIWYNNKNEKGCTECRPLGGWNELGVPACFFSRCFAKIYEE